jgi:lysyl-tRNA synthetase class I
MKAHIGIMNELITEEIINKVFRTRFNDGRRKCGLVGIC